MPTRTCLTSIQFSTEIKCRERSLQISNCNGRLCYEPAALRLSSSKRSNSCDQYLQNVCRLDFLGWFSIFFYGLSGLRVSMSGDAESVGTPIVICCQNPCISNHFNMDRKQRDPLGQKPGWPKTSQARAHINLDYTLAIDLH